MHTLGDTADPDSAAFQRRARIAAQPKRAPTAIEKQMAANYRVYLPRKAELAKTVSPPYTVAGPTLSPIGRQFQEMVLARDWDALFKFLPAKEWGQYGMLGKYSFVDDANGNRVYIPFSEDSIRRFVFSPYYRVQPGHTCTDEQRAMGVAALTKASEKHKAKFPASDFRHIWPIYPGWGYPGQKYGCEKYQPSTWVKIRKPVVIATAAVAAVYLGPLVYDKVVGTVTGAGTSAGSAAGSSGIVGAGTKAGAVGIKAGAAGSAVSAGTVAQGAGAASLFGQVKSASAGLIKTVNQGRTINAIVNGELPPPPIGIEGDSFTEWAAIQARKELEKEYQRKLTAQEERQMMAEIEALQRELKTVVPRSMPKSPNSQVPAVVQQKSAELAISEQETQTLITALLAIAGIAVLSG